MDGVADEDADVETDGEGDGVPAPCDENPITAATIPPAARTPTPLRTIVRVRETTGQFCRMRRRGASHNR